MKLGIDIGSTSLKGVLLNNNDELVFKKYIRHHANITTVLLDLLKEVASTQGREEVQITFTGSIGMGISERLQLPSVFRFATPKKQRNRLYIIDYQLFIWLLQNNAGNRKSITKFANHSLSNK